MRRKGNYNLPTRVQELYFLDFYITNKIYERFWIVTFFHSQLLLIAL